MRSLLTLLLLVPLVGFSQYWQWDGWDINGEAYYDISGWSVSMNAAGDRLAIGAIWNDGNGSGIYPDQDYGHVRVYSWNGTSWAQQGQDIDGEAAGDNSGYSVSMNAAGDRLAIGSYKNSGNGYRSGHVRIYEWNGSSWTQQGQDIDGESFDDYSGWSVSMNAAGDRAAIGACRNDGNTGNFNDNRGHVRIYAWNGTSWIQQGQDLDGEASGDLSGHSVSMNAAGDRVAIGAYGNDGFSTNNWDEKGHVRIYSCACCSYSTNFISACDSYTWIDSTTYTSSTNTPVYRYTNAAGCDSVVTLDLTINNSNTGTDALTACNSYTWIDGNTYTSSTNTPTYTLTNAAGCDSVVTLNLTVNTVNNSVTNTTPTLTADATGATYQWLDCNNNYAPIPGETNQSYTATANGSYAVEVTQNGCVDTSACEQVNNVGITEINSSITLHPNPTTGVVELQGINGSFKVDVYDYAGKYLQSTSRSTIDLSDYPSGIYLLKVAYGDKTEELRVVKE